MLWDFILCDDLEYYDSRETRRELIAFRSSLQLLFKIFSFRNIKRLPWRVLREMYGFSSELSAICP
jgi:hypothetical protein